MSAYLPEGYRPLLEVIAQHGAELLGPKLASGLINLASIRDGRMMGVVHPGQLFRSERASEMMRSGRFVDARGAFGAEILVQERSLRKAGLADIQTPTKKASRPKGRSFAKADAQAVARMKDMVAAGQATGPFQAATMILDENQAAVPGASYEAKRRRLTDRYGKYGE